MNKLTPTPEEIEALGRRIPDGPVVIVNLLKFKPGQEARAAYMRYIEGSHPASDPNIEILYSGLAWRDVGHGEDWDHIIIARYRRYEDFARVVTHPAWRAAALHRPEALEKTLMIVSQPEAIGDIAKK